MPAPESCRPSAPTRAESWLPRAWVCARVTRSSGARPGAMTVQFGADAGRRLRHQENWEVRDKGKHRERKEFKKSEPCTNLEMYLKVSEPPRP